MIGQDLRSIQEETSSEYLLYKDHLEAVAQRTKRIRRKEAVLCPMEQQQTIWTWDLEIRKLFLILNCFQYWILYSVQPNGISTHHLNFSEANSSVTLLIYSVSTMKCPLWCFFFYLPWKIFLIKCLKKPTENKKQNIKTLYVPTECKIKDGNNILIKCSFFPVIKSRTCWQTDLQREKGKWLIRCLCWLKETQP